MGGGQIFLKTFRASLFNEDLSNEPNLGQIHLAGHCGQYLYATQSLHRLKICYYGKEIAVLGTSILIDKSMPIE
jgi:hypothetical protein